MKKAVFIDKDGTLIEDVPYNVSPGLIEWEPYVVEGLRLLKEQDFLLIVISNQPGIGFGYFSEYELNEAFEAIQSRLYTFGLQLDGFYYCPHHPDASIEKYKKVCRCRKPSSELFKRAASDWNINLSASWMIGDILNDVEAGNKCGCKTILINNGHETEWKIANGRMPTFISNHFKEAAQIICSETIRLKYERTVDQL